MTAADSPRVIGGGEELEAAIRAVRDREAMANSPEAQAASRAMVESLEPRAVRHARYLAIGTRALTGIVVQAMERQLGLDILPPDPNYRRPGGVLHMSELAFRVVAMLRMTAGALDRAWHDRMYLHHFVPPWERSALLEGRAA